MKRSPADLLQQLQSDKCRCGRAKARRRTFCEECYFALPRALRFPLYRALGQGYAEAVAAAEESLDDRGRGPASPPEEPTLNDR